MLKLILPMLSLLLLPVLTSLSMQVVTSSLIIMTMLSMFFMFSSSHHFIMSNFMAMDTMSASLIVLTVWVSAMMILASMKIFNFKNQHKMFIFMTTALLLILTLCFSASNIFLFYIWFEASLIPTMILVMMWGYQPERLQASMYLMIYTVSASLPMLAALYMIFVTSKTVMIPMFMNMSFPDHSPTMWILWLMAIGGFLVKLPMFITHLWLPKAHVEAPIAGSMILAAILLKLGGYGILRMSFLFQPLIKQMSSMLLSISLVGAISTSLICIRQPDLKSLIAYSSVSHMGLLIAGASSGSCWGMQASLAMMIAHGLSSSALFVLANISYEITSTRSLFLTKGILSLFPILSMWWFLFTASNMAAPPTINLLSEIMLISSILSYSFMTITLIGLVGFMTAAYSLLMYSSMNHGSPLLSSNANHGVKTKDFALMFMHIIPVIFIVMKPETITNWM